ncbi:MAG: 50S ribosome-binding GTPase [Treponema sp.]|nr:50S ribosome-binding GTPase [Treponema sp.]
MYSAEQQQLPVMKMTGKTLEECREKLYMQFGRDYTIRDMRTILKPKLLFGHKELLEVSYTVSSSSERSVKNEMQADKLAAFKKNQEELLKTAAMTAQVAAINTKISEMKDDLAKQIQGIAFASGEKHATIKKIEEMLADNEFTFSYINEMTEKIKKTFSLEALDDFKAVERKVVDWIGHSISIAPARAPRPPHVVVIVGPTGVGKTTTLAKLAAKKVVEAREAHYKIPDFSFITIDSMRVGAYEQIARFGDLLETQVEKAESVEDLKKIYDEKKNSVDAIFIDTSGYSPNDSKHIGEMKSLLEIRGLHPDVYLSVAASTKARDLENIIQNYEPFGYGSVIVTKCDESHQYGNIISVLHEKNKKISYITDGQNVVRDIRRADTVQFLINLSGFDVDRIHIEDEFGE